MENVCVIISYNLGYDNGRSVYYEVVDENDRTISGVEYYSTATDTDNIYLSDFTANTYDGIVYITYGDPHEFDVIYDLKTNFGYPNGPGPAEGWGTKEYFIPLHKNGEKLFNKIKSFNPNLIAGWEKPEESGKYNKEKDREDIGHYSAMPLAI